MITMGFWVEWMTCLHSYSQAESHELPQAKIGRDLTLLEIDLILASQRRKIFKNLPTHIFIYFLAWADCLRSLECKYSIRIHINGLLTNLEKLGKFFVQKPVAALSTCFDEDGTRVEGLERGLTSATEDIWMGYAIKFVLALRSCTADDCKFGPKRVLHYVWRL